MIASKFLNKSLPLGIKDLYPNALMLLQMEDNDIYLIDTNRPTHIEHYIDIMSYMKNYKVNSADNKYHFLNFKDISETRIGKFLISSYKRLESISILEESKQLVEF